MQYTCRCGRFVAQVDTREGIRAVCYCNSCREFAEKTGAADALDAAGGSDLYQVAPYLIHVIQGADQLTWMRLTPTGPLRWYTRCCKTPVANTLASRSLPFATLQSHRFADPAALGPVICRVNRRFATDRVPDDGKGVGALYRNFAARMLKSYLTGGWRRTPFFDEKGALIDPGGAVPD